MQKISKNIKDTAQIAQDFICKIKPEKKGATLVCLQGELGAGKTTFTQTVGKFFGVKKTVNSPTFVIMKSYELKNKIFKKLIHIDAYRLKNENDILKLGWAEIISNPAHIVLVEWPENVAKIIPKKHNKVSIVHTKEGHRKIKIKTL